MQKQDKNNEPFIKETSIPGVLVVERPTFPDERGIFHEIVRLNDLREASGIDFRPVQLSHSVSLPGVIRAIHTEKLNKLIYPVTGKMFAVIVDVRIDSPMFGKHETFMFDNDDPKSTHAALFLPAGGIGNSICVVGDKPVNYLYAVDKYWEKGNEQGIAWDDPDLNILWPVKNPIISDRDRNNPRLRDLFPEKFST
jgi:dTDP-4-dehydrorhamnose 3,5-epimerase